jgi:septum formation inhibitor MinC
MKIRVRGRSFMAFVIAPEPPLDAWLAELDAQIRRSPGFFEARPVIGSVASGAEVLAGGSVHIYGTLRGRAIAGALGKSNARIFCRRFEAELVSIDGFYKTADQMDPAMRGRSVEVGLVGDAIVISPLR